MFSQEEINDQLIVVIIKSKAQTQDHLNFHVTVNDITYKTAYRMEFKWSVVYFPYAEYSICENAGALNIVIHRSGNINISSYVTISAIEQTAKEGLDYVSRRVSKIQFDPGVTELLWKIVVVQDDLEEAPIEQLQVVLTDPESCLIFQHNRTIVSIYDLNRGSCAIIPAGGPKSKKIDYDIKPTLNANDDNHEEIDDNEMDAVTVNFPMDCNRNIYGLLHFEHSSQALYLCNGSKWSLWSPQILSTDPHLETSTFLPLSSHPQSISTLLPSERTTAGYRTTSSGNETDECLKGWIEYDDECYKFHRPPLKKLRAEEICKSYPSGSLAIVKSIEHNNWLVQLSRGKPFWIGLESVAKTNEWGYTSPGDATFLNWKKGFPRYSTNNDMKNRCVIVRGSGLWINKNCETHEHSFICTVPMSISTLTK